MTHNAHNAQEDFFMPVKHLGDLLFTMIEKVFYLLPDLLLKEL